MNTKRYSEWIDKLALWSGYTAAFICILMILIVFFDVMARYFFNSGSLAMQELEWHCFAAMFLLGTSYALQTDNHVRVDVFYEKMNRYEQAKINLFGTVFFLIPMCIIIICSSFDFVEYSFSIAEKSPDPGGLPARYILKSIIPISYLLVLITGIGSIFKNINILLEEDNAC